MKIIEIRNLEIPEVKVIKFQRFIDERGYFTETLNIPQMHDFPELDFIRDHEFQQINEAHSKANTLRGLHFQWSPYMGKLVRCIRGRLIDFALDIRRNSPTFGKIVAADLKTTQSDDYNQWMWIPPGFAHGTLLTEESTIEYLCTATWSRETEFGISPLSDDIDWSLCDKECKVEFMRAISSNANINERDKNYPNLRNWLEDDRSANFVFGEI